MTLPTVTRAGKDNLLIQQGATFGPYLYRWKGDDDYGIDLVTGGISGEASLIDQDGAEIIVLTTPSSGFVIVDPEIVSPEAISSALVADGVIVSAGAQFVSSGVRPGDRVILAGQPLNNTTTARVVSVDSEDQITTDQTFDPESALGTVSVLSEGWFYLEISADVTSTFDFDSGKWDCEFIDPSVSPEVRRRPLRGAVELERNA